MKKQNEKIKIRERGITLIALVVTIIVLLILAGVSILMLTGEGGILKQAEEARNRTGRENLIERVQMEILENMTTSEGKVSTQKLHDILSKYFNNVPDVESDEWTNFPEEFPTLKSTDGEYDDIEIGEIYGGKLNNANEEGKYLKPGEKAQITTKDNYKDENNQLATVPKDFHVSTKEGEKNVEDGLVIIDDDGNEFVWIPITNEENYNIDKQFPDILVSSQTRYDTGYLPVGQITEYNDGELTFEKEKELVISKGGFYISRYEAGDGSASTNRTDNSGITGRLVSKKGSYVYDWISQENAKAKAREFVNNENVKSALMSGVQWDMVMHFVNSKKDGIGNTYIVTETSNDPSKSDRHLDTLMQSGKNEADKVCNIYDLEGNACEYVAERSNYEQDSAVHRGGMCTDLCPAAFRYNNEAGSSKWGIGFRFVLYVM